MPLTYFPSEGKIIRLLRPAIRTQFKRTKRRLKRSWFSTNTATGTFSPRFGSVATTPDTNF